MSVELRYAEVLGTKKLQEHTYERDQYQKTQAMVSPRSVFNLHVHVNAANYRDEDFVGHLLVSSCFFFDQHSHVRNDSGISLRIFQGEMVPVRATIRKYGLDLQRLCDSRRALDALPDLDRVDDRRETGIPDDGAAVAQADRHSG